MKHPWNFQAIARPLLAAVLALIVALTVTRPALADGAASTRNIILGAAAAIAGIIIYNNIHHKQVAHNTIVGYTRDGGTVYADGRIVYPNGDVLYTGNGNGAPCSWDGSNQYCGDNPAAYYPNGNGYQNYPYGNQNYQDNGYQYSADRNEDAEDRYENNNQNAYNQNAYSNYYANRYARKPHWNKGRRNNKWASAQWNGNGWRKGNDH